MTTQAQFEQVQPVRLYQRIVEQIEAAVARGDLKPGSRLPSERELVAQFGASRPTIREALRVLESNGIVRSRPGDPNGPEILSFSTHGLHKQMTRLIQADGASLAEVLSFRMVVDGAGCRLAARLRTEADLEALERTITDLEASRTEGYEAFSRADVAFHQAIAAASRNSILGLCNNVVRDVVLSLISTNVANAVDSPELMEATISYHREVLIAVREQDAEAAARSSSRSIYNFYNGYLSPAERDLLRAMLHPDDQTDAG